jgi:hypothetical protein
MRYLLDTSLISELVKNKPQRSVLDWVKSCEEESLFLSVLTLGELQKGVIKLPQTKKREFWLCQSDLAPFDHLIWPHPCNWFGDRKQPLAQAPTGAKPGAAFLAPEAEQRTAPEPMSPPPLYPFFFCRVRLKR